MKAKQVKSPDDIPEAPHYAFIVYYQQTTYVPGDERSRTCPGHGYPEHTETTSIIEHWVTTEVEELEVLAKAIDFENARAYGTKKRYSILKVEAKATIQQSIKIGF